MLGLCAICGWMDKAKVFKRKFFLLFIATIIFIFCITVRTTTMYRAIPKPRKAANSCPLQISEQTITPLKNTTHLLVSAYMDQRVKDLDIRIIGIFRSDSVQPLYCLFCCAGSLSNSTPATISQHTDNFGFPFITTDVMCKIPYNCSTTHVSLLTQPDRAKKVNQTWLPIRNQKINGRNERKLQFNFTVCVSSLFGDYNNVLQFAQTLEMYRLLGVDRVVIYNTSCGPDLERLLQSYSKEGFVEIVPWPIDQHLNPSRGWLFSKSGGDVHYFGQLTTLNECIYRSMARSRYVLLNDIDEIIMPYQHDDLMSLMDTLKKTHPNTGVFFIENHIFPKKHFEPSGRFHLPQWNGVPGVNILEHIYKEEPDRNIYHPYKMIVQPRLVERTSVHEVLRSYGQQFKVPLEVCRIIQVRESLRGSLTLDELHEDKRLWDFQEKLIPNVDRVLRRAGLLSSDG
ncbi:uncharacterized protein LOC121953587 [Plectropomus leopardus]|uniref:uncharacterized protein LOC121953587 n=1 Tax=Plectropomus leopardus TaxID=160734 RepID=UPI001C4BFD71|nr:uncharacterized protein LOC121953587 [Plectropomus leopardus]